MPALASDLRRQLENVVTEARDVAEAAARSALQKRAVDVAEPFSHFGPKEKELRNRLRARGRQVGDVRHANGTQSIDQLTQELAYEFWHRMLFARFLAENNLLIHPDDGVSVSLEECEGEAPNATPPAPNGFVLAARYASKMLPLIFRTDDVLLEIEFAPEHRLALEKLLGSLPTHTFLADDSLGWVYQFWQSKKKDEVNKSGDKIDGRTLPAVTQLFTEHYMVQFLLHNTIGAWWCARHSVQGPAGGAGVSAGKSPVEMEYLRWRDDGTPAAGKFEGWPNTLTEFKMLDPCCGSGHFLVAAFNLLVPLRMHDERLTAAKACDAVLRDNIFGLELDPRCTQIAAFALALAAWKYPDAGGYRPLPSLNIACSGQCVTGKKEEWVALANGDEKLRNGMERLFDLFRQAPHLGSLIDPRREKGDLFGAGYTELQPLLAAALAKHEGDLDLAAVGVAAQGIAKAALLLTGSYTLVLTNVPYRRRGDHADALGDYCDTWHYIGRADLATVFFDRCHQLCAIGGTTAIVSPQNWLFLDSYEDLRKHHLQVQTWQLLSKLGPRAFETISGERVEVSLLVVSKSPPTATHSLRAVHATSFRTPSEKSQQLVVGALEEAAQKQLLRNPGTIVTTDDISGETLAPDYAECFQVTSSADSLRYVRNFWELPSITKRWHRCQMPPEATKLYAGRESVLDAAVIEKRVPGSAVRGEAAWGKLGVAIGQMSGLPATLYTGEYFADSTPVIVPKKAEYLPAVWYFCVSPAFYEAIRKLNPKLSVNNGYVNKVEFDYARWSAAANEAGPLPEPSTDDPTQWLFKGNIATCIDPLQVAVARLLGYRWPDQPKDDDAIDKLTDSDGIVCLPGVRGEPAAAERLLEVLHTAYGNNWSDSVLHKLLTDAECKAGATLDDWLRNQFFEQHCKRFQSRPFVWHIWDGRKDGFSALVNYHKLTHKGLENLTFSYLGDWITAQSKSDKVGADLRLVAAQGLQEKLKLILAGERPYDIFVRWKPLHEQAIGWNPDLNDGVRMNIRPFVEADILRKTPNIKWTKDRGKEPQRDKDEYPWFWTGNTYTGDRVNDVHLTNAEKQAARTRKGVK